MPTVIWVLIVAALVFSLAWQTNSLQKARLRNRELFESADAVIEGMKSNRDFFLPELERLHEDELDHLDRIMEHREEQWIRRFQRLKEITTQAICDLASRRSSRTIAYVFRIETHAVTCEDFLDQADGFLLAHSPAYAGANDLDRSVDLLWFLRSRIPSTADECAELSDALRLTEEGHIELWEICHSDSTSVGDAN